MQIQHSYQTNEQGRLYIVPTPIGNLDDMTFRAVATLKEADTILAEDTRHSLKLLKHFNVENSLLSFHEHNKEGRIPQVMERLEQGEVFALVSDAGMPAISDPGYELVCAAIAKNISVIVLPGATAAICALVGSGLPTNEFLFHGFLPRKKQEKKRTLERMKSYPTTIIFYESPFRVKDTVQDIEKYVGNRTIVIAREISKLYEQYIRGTCSEVSEWLDDHELKGECCVLMEGATGEESSLEMMWWTDLTITEHVRYYESEGELSNKDAMKQVAKDRSLSKRDVYQVIHVEAEKKET